MTTRNVCIVFEPATDEHISKDVIQIPIILSKLLRNSTPYLITRPNSLQVELPSVINCIYHGAAIPSNDIALKSGSYETLKLDSEWYSSACKVAAKYGNFLMLFPFFGNYIDRALKFSIGNILKGKRPFVYIKQDRSPEVLLTYPKRKHNFKGKLRAVENLIKHFPVSAISTESKETYALYRDIYPELSYKTLMVQNCPNELEVSSLPSRTAIAERKRYSALAVGRFNDPVKAFDVLMAAWIHSAPKCQGWTLNLVGEYSDKLYQYWKVELEKHDLIDTVNWIGFTRDRRKLWNSYCEATIFIHPSRAESASIVMSEAIAAGCSLIVTPVGDVSSLLSPDDPGLVPTDDIQRLADTITLFANNQSIRQKQIDYLKEEADRRRWPNQLFPIVERFQSR
jgi:glycosyltransferase involved in cell wall biosynthesis